MTELKTLKDFIKYPMNYDTEDYNCALIDLRLEVIKWVKEFEKSAEPKEHIGNYRVAKFIKHFFNLTEEDLLIHSFANRDYKKGFKELKI